MQFKKITINSIPVDAEVIDLTTYTVNKTLELTIDNNYYTILPLKIQFAKNLFIEGYEITNPEKPKHYKIYLEL